MELKDLQYFFYINDQQLKCEGKLQVLSFTDNLQEFLKIQKKIWECKVPQVWNSWRGNSLLPTGNTKSGIARPVGYQNLCEVGKSTILPTNFLK